MPISDRTKRFLDMETGELVTMDMHPDGIWFETKRNLAPKKLFDLAVDYSSPLKFKKNRLWQE